MNSEQDVIDLIQQWKKAKQDESEAEERRVNISKALAKILGAPVEGSQTHDVGDFKVTVKQPINRKVDWAEFDTALLKYESEHQDAKIHVPTKMKRELDETGLKWIRDNQPELYSAIAKSITATPGRIGIDIKERA